MSVARGATDEAMVRLASKVVLRTDLTLHTTAAPRKHFTRLLDGRSLPKLNPYTSSFHHVSAVVSTVSRIDT